MARKERRFRYHPKEAETLHSQVIAIPPSAAEAVIDLLHTITDIVEAEHADHLERQRTRDQASARITNIQRLAGEIRKTIEGGKAVDRDRLAAKYDVPLELVDAWITQTQKKQKQKAKAAKEAAVLSGYRKGLSDREIAAKTKVSLRQISRIIAKHRNKDPNA